MSVQPSQPVQGTAAVSNSDKPYPEISGPGSEVFQVTSLKLGFEPGLSAWPDRAEPTSGTGVPPTHMISCAEVKFEATVHFTGESGWKIGWVQTVEPSIFWVHYRGKGRAGRHRMELEARLRDGDNDEGYWYDDGEEAVDGTDITVEMSDEPNLAFYFPTYPAGASPRFPDGSSLQGLEGLVPKACGGQKEFWALLLAVREDAQGQPAEKIYLHHVHWRAVFDGQINMTPGKGPTVVPGHASGSQLIAEGVGQGGATLVLDGPEVGPDDEVNRAEMESL
jgi:hypothetical protein